MKANKLFVVLLCLISVSCAQKTEKPVIVDDFLAVPEYNTEEPSSSYELTSTSGNSYWFVVVEDMDGETRRNDFIVQEHPYFSYEEAKNHFKNETKKGLFYSQYS